MRARTCKFQRQQAASGMYLQAERKKWNPPCHGVRKKKSRSSTLVVPSCVDLNRLLLVFSSLSSPAFLFPMGYAFDGSFTIIMHVVDTLLRVFFLIWRIRRSFFIIFPNSCTRSRAPLQCHFAIFLPSVWNYCTLSGSIQLDWALSLVYHSVHWLIFLSRVLSRWIIFIPVRSQKESFAISKIEWMNEWSMRILITLLVGKLHCYLSQANQSIFVFDLRCWLCMAFAGKLLTRWHRFSISAIKPIDGKIRLWIVDHGENVPHWFAVRLIRSVAWVGWVI